MPDLGPHSIFILGAYGVTFAAVTALALAIVEDDRKQRRLLADLERRGIKRRSAGPPATPKANVAQKPRRKPRP
jgi:heme exporter protein D